MWDAAFLNGEESALSWVPAPPRETESSQPGTLRDDFIYLPPRQVVGAGNDRSTVGAADAALQKEAKVVDPRLFRKVTLQLKGGSLDELCAALQSQTGVRIRASRGVQDEKLTVLVKDEPARDVMRAVARLFTFLWSRSGSDPDYEYEVIQTLKSRLEEEELRNRDAHAALLALDAEMEQYRPYLGQSVEQLQGRLHTARGGERERIERLVQKGNWGAVQLYFRLSPQDRLALSLGEELKFSAEATRPERLIPEQWRGSILRAWQMPYTLVPGQGSIQGQGDQLIADIDGSKPEHITLKVDRTELGELSFTGQGFANVPAHSLAPPGSPLANLGWGLWFGEGRIAAGRSPSTAVPENARINAALRKEQGMQKPVSFAPAPPRRAAEKLPEEYQFFDRAPRITTAEFWEAVHKETGTSVVADYYTRLYAPSAATVKNRPLFDALCGSCDNLGLRWRKDGSFLMGRSTSYFWDKLKEVPKRYLERWRARREQQAGMPLDDLLEIATLTDAQLDASRVGEGIRYLYGLTEWPLVGHCGPLGGPHPKLRPHARFVASLTADQRRRAMEPKGLPFGALSRQQQQAYAELLPEETLVGPEGPRFELLRGAVVWLGYAPAGWYQWSPRRVTTYPYASGSTPPLALANALKVEPRAEASQVSMSPGELVVYFRLADESEYITARLRHGKRAAYRRDGKVVPLD
jgi:hypothetical protein